MTADLPGDWTGLVVIVAGTPWRGVQFASHHVARALAKYAPVLYVDPPLSRPSTLRHPDRRLALREPRLRVVAPRIARLTPVTLHPRPHRAGMRSLTERVVRRSLARATDALGGDVRAVLAFAVESRVFGVSGEQVSVYYAKDDFSAGADLLDLSARFLLARERWLAKHADFVVAHSPTLMERWKQYHPTFVPNGVDAEFFAHTDDAPVPDDVQLSPPIAGFVGHISKRIDMAALEAIADRGHSLLLVGKCQDTYDVAALQDLLTHPNVRWTGPKPYDQLPSYLRMIDVGLVPYTRSAFNEASFPLKTLEYLAAGRPVVSTDLPAVRWLDTDFVGIENDPVRFADLVERAFASSADPDTRRARMAFAEQHSWERRVETLAGLLGLDRRTPPEVDDESADQAPGSP